MRNVTKVPPEQLVKEQRKRRKKRESEMESRDSRGGEGGEGKFEKLSFCWNKNFRGQ